ncbi:MAG: hypothetical protein ACJA0M_000156 [Chitinophagales bacterium]|jgi:hypothetical protein
MLSPQGIENTKFLVAALQQPLSLLLKAKRYSAVLRIADKARQQTLYLLFSGLFIYVTN